MRTTTISKTKKKTRTGSKRRSSAKPAIHYTEQYLLSPAHPITVNVVGCGGTGSQVLNSLARLNAALKALGHPGLFIRAIDPDRVTEANMGRQLFSPVDINLHKCVVLISRINRFFGLDWVAEPDYYGKNDKIPFANVTISCVDSGAARASIKKHLARASDGKKLHVERGDWDRNLQPYEKPYYWMDFGNQRDRGQVVIGTVQEIKQPKSSEYRCLTKLPAVDHYHPDILIDSKDDDQGPSCSLAEALGKQDLFINTNLANMGLAILWKMFREAKIFYHGCYLNLESLSLNPIKVK